MKLPHPFIQLPLRFDADVLAAEIAALGEGVWQPHPQGFPGNSMLPLLARGGHALDPSYDGQMAPTPELLRCPYLMQVMASFGAVLGRTRLMRLDGQAEVTPHVDQGYYWAERVRVHVPIVTQPSVRFMCGGATINMAAGECWIFDTWREHHVINDDSRRRIHLVADTVGGGKFWGLVDRGRAHDATLQGWEPLRVLPTRSTAAIACERYNIPLVMTPWEASFHIDCLLADVAPDHPDLPTARLAASHFLRAWRGLWAEFGDSGSGHDAYFAELQRFFDTLPEPVARLPLANGTQWVDGLLARVAKMAVKQVSRATRPG